MQVEHIKGLPVRYEINVVNPDQKGGGVLNILVVSDILNVNLATALNSRRVILFTKSEDAPFYTFYRILFYLILKIDKKFRDIDRGAVFYACSWPYLDQTPSIGERNKKVQI